MLLVPFFRGFARHLYVACLALTATAAVAFGQTASTAADGYDPNVDGNVYALVRQGDGKLLVAGLFTHFQPNGGSQVAEANIARLNLDGTVDASFHADVDGAVRSVVVQPNGSILIGGEFSHVGGAAHAGIARLQSTGAVDASFNPVLNSPVIAGATSLTPPKVYAVALQGTNVVVGGSFSVTSTANSSTYTANNLVRYAADGTLDTAFDPNPNGTVLAITPYAGNQLLIGGGFTQLQPPGVATPTNSHYIARLNSDGSVDATFTPQADNGVTSIVVQSDGMILIGGYFSNVQGTGMPSMYTRTRIARLLSNGYLDGSFIPVIGGDVTAIALALDGGIYVGGRFTSAGSVGAITTTHSYAVRIETNGTLDETFNPGVNAEVDAFAFDPDNKIVLGGYFTRAQPPGVSTGIIRNHLARVLPNGELDTAFQLDPGGRILGSVVQSDGKIVIVGSFTNVGGVTRNHIARLNADGSVDLSYNPNANDSIYALAYQNKNNENQVLIGGLFTTIGGVTRNRIARLNADGTVDTNFDPNISGTVGVIVVQPDGNILVGGAISFLQPAGQTTVTARSNLLRLTSAGQIDTGFNPTPNSLVSAIALQSDGKILIGGSFTTLQPGATGNTVARDYIARLNADGTVEPTFDPAPNSSVSAIAVQADGKVLAGGRFTGVFPPGATAPTARNYLARFNSDGSIDTSFDPEPNRMVLAIGVQPDGKILIGGAFTTLQPAGDTDWTLRKYFARLTSDGKVDATLNLDLNEEVGNRVDSINVLSDGSFFIGGTFVSLQPIGSPTRVTRNHFAQLTKDGQLTSFDPGAGGPTSTSHPQIRAIALQSDGHVVVGGAFTDLSAASSSNLARFGAEGNADRAFNSAVSASGPVNAIGVRTQANATQTQLGGLAWFNSNGTLLTTFNPNIRIQGQVNVALVQTQGSSTKLIIGGAFSDPTNHITGNLARYNSDGTLDTSFSVKLDGAVTDMALQSDGKLIIVGTFLTVNGTTRNHVARVDATGTVDSFDPNASAAVNAVLVQSDGSILLAGLFTTLTPNGATTATTRTYLARVDSTGAVDSKFNPVINSSVNALAFDPVSGAQDILIGGAFNGVNSTSMNYVARLKTDGTLDTTLAVNPNGMVTALAVQSDGSVLIGGYFTSVQPTVGGTQDATATVRNHIVRVASSGAVDKTFDPNPNDSVSSITVSGDGSIYLTGAFTALTPNSGTVAIGRNHVVRLKSDGSVDDSFSPDVAGSVFGATVAPDGTVVVAGTFSTLASNGILVVGGSFGTIGGVTVQNLALVNGDGTVSGAFLPNPNGDVNAVLTLPDGRFIVGGKFTSIAGVSRNGIARFASEANQDAFDSSYNPSVSGPVTALALQSDGKVIVGANGVTRINTDGSTDTTFTAGVSLNGPVGIEVQPDGRILVGVNSSLVRLNSDGSVDSTFAAASFAAGSLETFTLQTDGSIIVAGEFTNLAGSGINYVARLTSTGTVDPTFNPAPDNAVTALAIQSDGRVLLGGAFNNVGGVQRVGLARVSNTSTASETLAVSGDGKTITWTRSGISGELASATFEESSDDQSWTMLGVASRLGSTSTWTLSNVNLPSTGIFFIRARGIAPSVSGRSSGIYETIRAINLSSPVAALSTLQVPIGATHYALALDSLTGTYRSVDLFSGVLVDNAQLVADATATTQSGATTRLANLSTRGPVTSATPLISGFVISGSTPRTVLIRVAGPSLAIFGVTDYLAAPELVLYNSSSAVIATNTGWNNDSTLSAAFARTGAFPFTAGSADAALLVTLNPGAYSVQAADAGDAGSKGGDALIEIYDADTQADSGTHLINLSSRGVVSPRGTLIGGLVVAGTAQHRFLVRGVGPALAQFGVGGVLADPQVAVYDAQGDLVAANDNWNLSSGSALPDLDVSAAVAGAASSIGAFPLASGSKDAAMLITLPAGVYTVHLTGVNGTGGAAMIEVYEIQ